MPDADEPVVPAGFALREPVSRGPVTSVVRAHSAHHGDVVLKCWNHPLRAPRARAAFEREARLHESLSPDAAPHPNIVAFVAAAGAGEERPWIAMRPGGVSLADVLRTRALGQDEAFRIARDILDGLAMLHDRRLVHGDLTPSNILVYNGRATLCDLGLAGRSGERVDNDQVGTPEYMAPELLADPARSPDARSDVYAAALVLGEVLAGTDLSDRLDHLVHDRAQSVRPEDRPPDAGGFACQFARLSTSTPAPSRRGTRRRFAQAVSIIGLLGALLGSGWWWQGRNDAVMTAPRDGAVMDSPIYPRGRARIASGEAVWIVQRSDDRSYELYAAPASLEPDRRGWDSTVILGFGPCDEGRVFDVWAIVLPDTSAVAREAARVYERGGLFVDLDRLPDEARTLGHARVTLSTYRSQMNRCPGTVSEVDSRPLG